MRAYHFRIFSLVAMAICFTLTAIAQPAPPPLDVSPIGDVVMNMYQETTTQGDEDSASTLNIDGIIHFGVLAVGKVGDWDTSAVIMSEIYDGVEDNTLWLDAFGTIQDDSMAFIIGLQNPWKDLSFEPKYVAKDMGPMPAEASRQLSLGTKTGPTPGNWYINFGLKALGLNLILRTDTDADDKGPMATGRQYKGTEMALNFAKPVGPVEVHANYHSYSTQMDENIDASADAFDGDSKASMLVGAKYSLTETMAIALTVETITTTDGAGDADALNATYMLLTFDMDLNEISGLSASYGTSSDDSGDNPLTESCMMLAYGRKVGGADLTLQYRSYATADEDLDMESTNTKIGASFKVRF